MATTNKDQTYYDANEINKKFWRTLVPINEKSRMYDLNAFRAGTLWTSMDDTEVQEIGDLKGKRVLHLMCHFGMHERVGFLILVKRHGYYFHGKTWFECCSWRGLH